MSSSTAAMHVHCVVLDTGGTLDARRSVVSALLIARPPVYAPVVAHVKRVIVTRRRGCNLFLQRRVGLHNATQRWGGVMAPVWAEARALASAELMDTVMVVVCDRHGLPPRDFVQHLCAQLHEAQGGGGGERRSRVAVCMAGSGQETARHVQVPHIRGGVAFRVGDLPGSLLEGKLWNHRRRGGRLAFPAALTARTEAEADVAMAWALGFHDHIVLARLPSPSIRLSLRRWSVWQTRARTGTGLLPQWVKSLSTDQSPFLVAAGAAAAAAPSAASAPAGGASRLDDGGIAADKQRWTMGASTASVVFVVALGVALWWDGR